MCVSLALLIDIWLFIFNGFTKVSKKSPNGHHVTAKKIQSCLKVVARNRQSGRKELLYPFQPSASPASHFLQSHRSFIARDMPLQQDQRHSLNTSRGQMVTKMKTSLHHFRSRQYTDNTGPPLGTTWRPLDTYWGLHLDTFWEEHGQLLSTI